MALVPLASSRDPVEMLLALATREAGAFSLAVPDTQHPVTPRKPGQAGREEAGWVG